VGEEQRPWWTQPPTPSPQPARPPAEDPRGPSGGGPQGGSGGAAEPRGARFRARMRQVKEQATGEMPVPGPRATGSPDQGSWALPQFEPPSPHPGAEPQVVDLRDLDDPHDPLSGTWAGGYGQPGAGHEDLTLTPERYSTYPAAPDGHPAPGDSTAYPADPHTERLPRVGEERPSDDALGVYGTPSRVAPGIPGLTGDADPVGHLRRLPGGGRLPGGRRLPAPLADALGRLPGRERLAGVRADGRLLAIGGGLIAVILVVVLVQVVTGGKDPAAPPPVAQAAGGSAVAAGTPEDFGKVAASAAEKDLARAGQAAGDVVGAWGWSDKNGQNLLATTRERSGANQTLRVIHVARLDKSPKTLRVMVDPGLPGCRSGSGSAGFTKNSVQVRDLDKDSVAEILVGWFARCGGPDAESTVKLALLSDGEKYILRGQGVVGSGGSQAPEPAAKSWPKPYLKAANAQFKELYF